jgi:hypothetical protein
VPRRSCCVFGACFLVPHFESAALDRAINICCKLVSAGIEVTVDKCVSGEKILGVFRRFEIVASGALVVAWVDASSRPDYLGIGFAGARHWEAIGAELPRSSAAYQSQSPRHVVQALQQSPEEPLCGVCIAPRLNKNVQHNAILSARDSAARSGSGRRLRRDATCLQAVGAGVAGDRRNSNRISCTTAAPSRRTRRYRAQPGSVPHRAS